jgi:hypothetical protein
VSEPVVRTLVVLVLLAKVDEVDGHGMKTQLSEGCDTTEPSGHILQSSLHFNTVLEVGASVLEVGGVPLLDEPRTFNFPPKALGVVNSACGIIH